MIFDKRKIASLPQTQNRSLAEVVVPSIRSQAGGEPGGRTRGPQNHILKTMSALTRWNPFREMEDIHDRLFTLFKNTQPRNASGEQESLTVSEWTPLVDITEDDKEYLIKAELPEVKKEDVKVTVENGLLTISGERKIEKEEKGKRYHRVERAYGSFVRSFSLPDDADGNKVNADFKDGVLRVHLAKSEHAKPKQIEVKVS
jgi:HSP20 family protein